MASNAKTITDWIADLKLGDEAAPQELWDRFFGRLCRALRPRVSSKTRMADEEDLALSAFQALFHGAQEGRFRRLESREDLWQILLVIGSRKAANLHRANGIRKQLGESALGQSPSLAFGIDRVVAADVDEDYLDDIEETCGELLSQLDPRLRELALWKLEGLTNEEISERCGRSVRTVERHLMLIRETWRQAG